MTNAGIKYQTKTASTEEIRLHLKECNENFIPPLDQKVNLHEYSKKIFEKAITFEAWADKTLVGMVAAYFNDIENLSGYITSVSVDKNYTGKGVAHELMKSCIEYARKNNFLQIKLEVAEGNLKAIQLYKKFDFAAIEMKDTMVKMKLTINNSNS